MHSKLARNVLIHRQIVELAAALAPYSIACILLKGAALIELFPDYSFTRVMDDIDILVHPHHIKRTREQLITMGYSPCPEDPWSYRHPDLITHPAPIDITDGLWYLTPQEVNETIDESVPVRISMDDEGTSSLIPIAVYCLKPLDLSIHIAAHAAVHHGTREKTWLTDIALISERWGDLLNSEEGKLKLKRYGLLKPVDAYIHGVDAGILYRLFLNSTSPLKGHVMRFLFLPFRRKIFYLTKTLFPSKEFIAGRYNISNPSLIFLYRFVMRPASLFSKLIVFIVSSFPGRRSS